ncbi:FAD-dependent monooxygenase [Alphaproteobacteria bacterium]|nr:FAD-dependent monooxygenase [Alphaproteobacteria bacterium]
MVQPGRAEIVGGGFGGLVAAAALADRGWSVILHERRGEIDAEGYGIAIQRNMALIFAALGIKEAVLAGGAHIDRRDSMDGLGNVLMSQPSQRSPYRIDRRHIVRLLADRARAAGAEIRLGSTINRVEADGTVANAAGGQARADLVIVADGIVSPFRDRLELARRHIWQRDGAIRVTIPRTPDEIVTAEQEGSVMIEAWADRRRVLYCPVNCDEFYVLMGAMVDDEAACATPIDVDLWAGSFPALRFLLERVAAQSNWDQARWAQFQTIQLKRWSTGRVAVLGDAAHAMPPYLAQGAGHAMMNALGLATALETAPDLASGLATWECRERPLTEHTQRWTRIYGLTLRLPRVLKPISIGLERHLPWLGAQYIRAANHVPTGCLPD